MCLREFWLQHPDCLFMEMHEVEPLTPAGFSWIAKQRGSSNPGQGSSEAERALIPILSSWCLQGGWLSQEVKLPFPTGLFTSVLSHTGAWDVHLKDSNRLPRRHSLCQNPSWVPPAKALSAFHCRGWYHVPMGPPVPPLMDKACLAGAWSSLSQEKELATEIQSSADSAVTWHLWCPQFPLTSLWRYLWKLMEKQNMKMSTLIH